LSGTEYFYLTYFKKWVATITCEQMYMLSAKQCIFAGDICEFVNGLIVGTCMPTSY